MRVLGWSHSLSVVNLNMNEVNDLTTMYKEISLVISQKYFEPIFHFNAEVNHK